MSQSDVLSLLNELGGVASTKQIRDLAKQKYPDRTLHLYITNRLKKLEKWQNVQREIKNGEIIWRIKRDE